MFNIKDFPLVSELFNTYYSNNESEIKIINSQIDGIKKDLGSRKLGELAKMNLKSRLETLEKLQSEQDELIEAAKILSMVFDLAEVFNPTFKELKKFERNSARNFVGGLDIERELNS